MTTKSGTNLGLLAGAAPGDAHYTELTRFLRGMDALVQPNVISRVASVPTSGMVDGDRYLITGGANAGQIARYTVDTATPGWEFYAPKSGWYVWSVADQKGYRFKGSPAAWGEESTGGSGPAGDSYATKAISSGTLDISAGTANIWGVTLNQDVTTVTLPTPTAVQRLYVIFTQDATGGRKVTWPSKVAFVNGMGAFNLAANSITIVSLLSVDNGASWYATAAPSSSGGGGGMTNPMTAAGDLIVGGNAGDPQRLAIGTEGQVPTVVSGKLTYKTPSSGGGGVWLPIPIGEIRNSGVNTSINPDWLGKYNRVTGGVTITIPPNSDMAADVGAEFELESTTGTLTVAAGSGVTLTIPGGSSATARAPGSVLRVKKILTNTWVLSGDLASSGGGGSFVPMPTSNSGISSSRQLRATDANTYFVVTSGDQVDLTIPAPGSVAFAVGTELAFEQNAPGAISISAGGGASLLIPPGRLAKTRGQASTMVIKKLGDYAWAVSGDLAHDPQNSTPTPSPIATIANDRTLGLSDANKTLLMNRNTASALTVTVPADSTLAFPDATEINLIQFGTSPVVITSPAGTTVYKPAGYNAKIAKQYGSLTLKKIAADSWILLGMLEVAS